ncbi:protein-L-isoaspartate(D-aspartate) O-methyltransferase [Tianweitania sp. BSSL-BM11]|uniref:Protein-L-isoaspartate O-methyltransferase n=1 Tax=Tianweitania aestuarii TaxID=2814886 RepID=A0ABS5RUD5_9HYPH|nr:protein-L-isoaspartate(D-aspartate) O-methyltransferase [Tianweitania aestuarii]MBS9720670.1 protein-L-isoaspartate(D-aspartate) O-methyltransferase [Tianweitania aestuarii]
MTPDALDREGFAAFMLRLRGQGLTDKTVLSAFEATPRRAFVPDQWQDHAWSDRMLPIPCGEALEGVDIQAKVLAALELTSSTRVLEIGTGSGYTAAVMGRLSARVLTLERYKTLVQQARSRIEALGIGNVMIRQADGAHGVAAEGPFDRIIAWASFDELPRGFVDQLSSGGVMIAPIGPADEPQMLVRLTKTGSRFEEQEVGTIRLQPMTHGMAEAL